MIPSRESGSVAVAGRCHNGIYVAAMYILERIEENAVFERAFSGARANYQLVIVGMWFFYLRMTGFWGFKKGNAGRDVGRASDSVPVKTKNLDGTKSNRGSCNVKCCAITSMLKSAGHSLGGGIAALLSMLLLSRFPRLQCLAYSPPGTNSTESARGGGTVSSICQSATDLATKPSVPFLSVSS
jgi:hypothetical protein